MRYFLNKVALEEGALSHTSNQPCELLFCDKPMFSRVTNVRHLLPGVILIA